MKGKIKKLVALALATIMVLAMGITAAAADITIDNAVEEETYTLYKLFDVSVADNATATSGYTYYLTAADYEKYGTTLTNAGVGFTASADGTRYTVNNVSAINAVTLADTLKENVASLNKIAEKTATSTTVEFNDLAAGYYFVDSSLGSLCSLNTANDDAIIVEKNSIPSITKKVQEDSTNNWVDEATADLLQTVNFRLTVNTGTNPAAGVPADETGVDADYTITDVLPDGMTYVDITSITGIAESAATTRWDKASKTLTITLNGIAVEELGQNADIVIEYTATVDDNATIGTGGNTNTVTLSYKNQSNSDTAIVKTYALGGVDGGDSDGTLTKVDEDKNGLAGVGFTLVNATAGDANNGKYATVAANSDKFDGWSDSAVKIYTNEDGEIHVEGLDAGTYTLTETDPLPGYNALDYTITVTIAENGAVTYTENKADGTGEDGATSLEIVNRTGSMLPSTGGIGTTIFYVVGGILVAGAGILLITKKRMSKSN